MHGAVAHSCVRSSLRCFLPRSSDPNHMSDALCVLELGPTLRERRSTTTQHKTMNAVWDQVFLFDDVLLQNHEFQAEKISLSVLHKSDFMRNKLIGR